jgi:putative tricarboxylic transport membrane protein
MDVISGLYQGFAVAFDPINLLYCFIGVFIGTLVGVLPGIGPISAMSLLLPVTLSGSPESGIIMMAGIYYGSMYGGSTTAVLVNIPGEAASVVTCIDGHEMAKRGRAGPALGISALGSFVAGTFAIVALMLVAPMLAQVAVAFGPPEYFSLMVLGLTILSFLTQGSMAKALLMAAVGVVVGLIGLDQINAMPRLTFDRLELVDGIGLVPVVMGLFGVAEILANIEQQIRRDIVQSRIGSLWPSREDLKASAGPVGRGTLLGFLLGVLPGGGAVIASFASYAMEKKLSRTPERFGKGAIEGRRGARSREQCGGRRRLHSADDARHPAQRHHGAAARCLRHPRVAARTADDEPESQGLLGHRRQYVRRQHHAAGAEHAVDRHVGSGPEGAPTGSCSR